MTEKKDQSKKDIIDNIKEKSDDFITDAKEALDVAKEKINETLSEENIEILKQKAEVATEIAKEKTKEFLGPRGSAVAGEFKTCFFEEFLLKFNPYLSCDNKYFRFMEVGFRFFWDACNTTAHNSLFCHLTQFFRAS